MIRNNTNKSEIILNNIIIKREITMNNINNNLIKVK